MAISFASRVIRGGLGAAGSGGMPVPCIRSLVQSALGYLPPVSRTPVAGARVEPPQVTAQDHPPAQMTIFDLIE
jgi:hypothetical protein